MLYIPNRVLGFVMHPVTLPPGRSRQLLPAPAARSSAPGRGCQGRPAGVAARSLRDP